MMKAHRRHTAASALMHYQACGHAFSGGDKASDWLKEMKKQMK